MQEIWRCHLAGELNEIQSLLFRCPRPPEELYDTETDPYETRNLVSDPNFKPVLTRMQNTLDSWLNNIGDMGRLSENEMVRQWYPGGNQPQTAKPVFIPIHSGNYGINPEGIAGTLKQPVLIQIYCATQGASIAYTFETGNQPHWLLYNKPLKPEPGKNLLRAKAIRIGYNESDETKAEFNITPE